MRREERDRGTGRRADRAGPPISDTRRGGVGYVGLAVFRAALGLSRPRWPPADWAEGWFWHWAG